MSADPLLPESRLYVFRTKTDGSPFTLFRYFNPTKLNDFVHSRISLTPPKFLNDPFEFAVTREVPDQRELEQMFDRFVRDQYEGSSAGFRAVTFATFKEAKDKVRASWVSRVMSAEFRDAEPHMMQEGLSRFFGVVCLAENPDNLLMWGHYADSYRGFVAEFLCDWEHVRHVPRARGTPFGIGFKVEYSASVPMLRRDFSNVAQRLCTKNPQWSYEQEWRVIRLLATSDFSEDKTGRRFLRFSPISLQRIICGHRMTNANKEQVAAMIRNNDFRHIRVELAHPDLSRQIVEFREPT